MTPGVAQLPKGMCLRPESARALLHAERFARKALSPMDTAITIEFSSALAGSAQPYALFRKIWENTRRAWNYRVKQGKAHGTFDAIAVWEQPAHGPIHVHWLLRWSPLDRDDLERRIRRALKKLAPAMPDRCLMVQPAKTTSKFAKYMAKGIDAPYAEHFYLKHSPQGPIPHRRIIISRSLGPTARKIYQQKTGLSPI
ncbi:hypothetical protein [Sphingomonas sp.]|jgi:hypothetical protein|uniref:hypothetical protein n=1 Tax=Sphingomonas sp. TaxID=28214 RepID=UPI0025CE9F58|nr:hypothetical protein [Sphingomonas sp.]